MKKTRETYSIRIKTAFINEIIQLSDQKDIPRRFKQRLLNLNSGEEVGIKEIRESIFKPLNAVLQMPDHNTIHKNHDSFLFYLVRNNHLETLEILFREKIITSKDINTLAHPSNDTLLMLSLAAESGHLEMVEALLAKGVDAGQASVSGDTALIAAAENGHIQIVKVLLAQRVDVNQALANGATALILAVQNGNIQIVAALLATGANVNASAANGATALQIITRNLMGVDPDRKNKIQALLLLFGADIGQINDADKVAVEELFNQALTSVKEEMNKDLLEQSYAFAMGNHSRLGAESAVKNLPEDIKIKIMSHVAGDSGFVSPTSFPERINLQAPNPQAPNQIISNPDIKKLVVQTLIK